MPISAKHLLLHLDDRRRRGDDIPMFDLATQEP
jgi:hypothetical protein